MTGDGLDALVLRVMEDGRPSSGDDLTGMAMDVDAYLGEIDEVDPDSITVRKTDDVRCLISAACRAASGVDLTAAARAVRRVWTDHLRYAHFEAHDLRLGDDGAVLEFVTQIGPSQLYVTGRIAVLPSARS